MSTPNQQRSRYPRPLKATHSFSPSGEPTGSSGAQGVGSGTHGCPVAGSSCLPSPPSPGPRIDGPGLTSSCEVASVYVSVSPPVSPNCGKNTASSRGDHFGKCKHCYKLEEEQRGLRVERELERKL